MAAKQCIIRNAQNTVPMSSSHKADVMIVFFIETLQTVGMAAKQGLIRNAQNTSKSSGGCRIHMMILIMMIY